MRRRLFTAAAVALTPFAGRAAHAQASDVTPRETRVDLGLVGHWQLSEVEDPGALDEMGATLEAMACEFEPDGEASVGVSIEQDEDTYIRERVFSFSTDGTQIVSEDAGSVAYELLPSGEMRLRTPEGLVVRLRRADSPETSEGTTPSALTPQ